MNAKRVVAKRIAKLCAQRDTTVNHLANLCGIPPTTIYSMLGQKSKPRHYFHSKICDGLDISLREFFNSPLFEQPEPIK